jgi:hypothetical protein
MGAANEADLIDNLYGEAILEHLFALALAYYPFIKTRSLCEKGSALDSWRWFLIGILVCLGP